MTWNNRKNFEQLEKVVLGRMEILKETKAKVVRPTIIYCSETWSLIKNIKQGLM